MATAERRSVRLTRILLWTLPRDRNPRAPVDSRGDRQGRYCHESTSRKLPTMSVDSVARIRGRFSPEGTPLSWSVGRQLRNWRSRGVTFQHDRNTPSSDVSAGCDHRSER